MARRLVGFAVALLLWGCAATTVFAEERWQQLEGLSFVETMGAYVGLCDWRPKFWRFAVSEEVQCALVAP